MHTAQHSYKKIMRSPTAIQNNTSPSTTTVDTKGYGYAVIDFVLGATDIALTALKVQESDDNSTWADVTGLVYGTSSDISGSTSALPSATDDDKIFCFEIDLRGRKRYLKLVFTIGNGSVGGYTSAVCTLSRPSDQPVTATERNLGNALRV